jgi:hypothetical protein
LKSVRALAHQGGCQARPSATESNEFTTNAGPGKRRHNLTTSHGFAAEKPRLVVFERASEALHRARHTPVWCVRLARLPRGADAAAVREAVTAAVLTGGFVGASAWDGAVQRLSPVDAAGRVVQTLLVVDNCEHVLAGAGAVIADLRSPRAMTSTPRTPAPVGSM